MPWNILRSGRTLSSTVPEVLIRYKLIQEVESLGVKESQDLENLQKENKKLMEDSTALKVTLFVV